MYSTVKSILHLSIRIIEGLLPLYYCCVFITYKFTDRRTEIPFYFILVYLFIRLSLSFFPVFISVLDPRPSSCLIIRALIFLEMHLIDVCCVCVYLYLLCFSVCRVLKCCLVRSACIHQLLQR
jgi:hypothetical protein